MTNASRARAVALAARPLPHPASILAAWTALDAVLAVLAYVLRS